MGAAEVELVRRAYEAFNARDVDAMQALVDPGIELRTTVETVRGMEGVVNWMRDAGRAIEDYAVAVGETVDAGARVLVAAHQRGRGRESGIPVELTAFHVWTVRGGRLAHMCAFTERAEAVRELRRDS